MKYTGAYKKEIAFPLGGIGSGSIGLAGNGRFVDIEIMNQPNRCSDGRFTHFSIKAEDEEKVLDARVLNTDLQPGYVGQLERPRYSGYGWGPDRGSMAGFPHFEKGEFQGNFPFAELDFEDSHFPGKVVMEAFNPLIPSNEDDSSIPGAFFKTVIENTTDKTIKYTLALSCNNYYGDHNEKNVFGQEEGQSYIHLYNTGDKDTTRYGDLSIITDCEDVSYQEYWFRGSWFDNSTVFWKDFCKYGKLKNRCYETQERKYEVMRESDIATLAAHVEIEPHSKKEVRFVLTWSNPYMSNTWEITYVGLSDEEISRRRAMKWKNYYATLYEDSLASAEYAMSNYDRLYDESKLYTDLIFGSTLPDEVKDAVTANVAILKSSTCLRLEDGSFYGFEGVHPHMGSCEGTCTHVWGYTYAMAFLFPKLERTARTLEYTASMQPDGGMGFRVQLPLGIGPTNHRPAVDGQYASALRVYREFMVSGDKEWLASIWEAVKETIAYAWSEKNPDKWDLDKDGIMEGRQHHTLDMELFSPNSWLSGMYLAGLKAGIELAEIMEDDKAKEEFSEVYSSGVKYLNEELFNGKYYYQKIDVTDKSYVEGYTAGTSLLSQDAVSSYWDEEHAELKYQIGEGASIDQVLGQWHADLLGLGNVFDKEKVESALQVIYENNFVRDMRNHVNPCRIYGLNDEKGTIICSYPEGASRPAISAPYAEETMHGFEYATASHMIYHGMEEEGLELVRAIRERYDGKRRNPWSEIECGSSYARSMASYALLLIYSGITYNANRQYIGFEPLHKTEGTYFWSLDTGFGRVVLDSDKMAVEVAYGEIKVKEICMDGMVEGKLMYNNEELSYTVCDKKLVLDVAVTVTKGESLVMQK